ncbi:methionyl-tRNA formyltransferase [Spiroplasma culicicola]|uniref:Methionyl-tRNA formyltransferase n=1 Tax=Spiroplasma culicicola AES-1 TaxID=1276246 RepID=W6A6L2_9MOLU|nr:methionyl-tRNA formyltransferase [Spiroplasma culicicola]AHI52718.1 methionyl-tRNA formyltransferase [Spiroplasma culicicola AES-1]
MSYKVIFCGTPPISVEILKGLENIDVEIVGIITQPDKKVGRKKEIMPSPVKQYSLEKKYPIIQPYKMIDSFEQIKALNADFLITCAFGQFVPQKILNLFKNSINVHASLLPKYRGGSPIQFAIKDGCQKTGISLMKMIKKMDAGAVYAQEELKIETNDDSGSLFDKMAVLGKNMIEKYLIDILNETLTGIVQDENEVTFAYNLTNEQEEIDWKLPKHDIVNFIRALSPAPIAFTHINDERIKIKKARVIGDEEIFIAVSKIFQVGEIVTTDKEGIIVQTIDGYIKILELQRSGKTMVDAGSFHFPNSPLHMGIRFGQKIEQN